MHQKKSEVQIGKESTGVSSDFNPTPSSIHQKHPLHSINFQSAPQHLFSSSSPLPPYPPSPPPLDTTQQNQTIIQDDPIVPTSKSTPHKRPLVISKSPTLSNSLQDYPFSPTPPLKTHFQYRIPSPKTTKAAAVFHLLRRLRHLRRLRVHLRLILLLTLPFFYFLVSHPSHSFFLDFLSAFAFSAALLFSLNLALPRLPSIRLFLARSFPIKLRGSGKASRPPLPVFWSIGSRSKSEKQLNSGCWVQAYSNGDVYEGEFHKGRCSGSGVYYYYMSGRYEGDWVDGKYDGYGVETWARGSRYRGQYRQGLRHGFGVYRFYTGDVYAGEWLNGQSHGCGVHTCDDGSRYVGEFKWGVKHGIGHYHFR
ncbi:hypothetical protein RJ639_017434 [Escallonia herrerae]|uniref:Uncharacterized protein n=1 Tax=Escallonia herrerae TaxID=1293975 RepID=A0AA88VE22_9ASTE|nr:hypothetical protein RJ639_017434 [Escallonia herrerae]